MTAHKLEFNGRVNEHGTLHIVHRAKFDEGLKRFAGKDVELTVSKKRRIRSIPINKYYWGVVVYLIRDAFIELGHQVDSELTHEFLKGRFNYTELIDTNSGEVIKLPKTTTDMSNTEFIEYMERIKQFASETLGIYIPEPNEQLRLVD